MYINKYTQGHLSIVSIPILNLHQRYKNKTKIHKDSLGFYLNHLLQTDKMNSS